MLLLALFYSLTVFAETPSPSLLSAEVKQFFGPEPKGFVVRFVEPAKKLRKAIELKREGKQALALTELTNLANHSEIADHATYELALAYRESGEFAKSSLQFSKFFFQFPSSPFIDSAKELIVENDCDAAQKEPAGKANAKKKRDLLLLCLQKTSWKDWTLREAQISSLLDNLKSAKDPMLGALVGEAILALPNNSSVRAKISNEFSSREIDQFTTLPRYRSKFSSPAGIKPVSQDSEQFDRGVLLLLEEKWSDAYDHFKKFIAEYPQSEHSERAEYWLAKCEEKLGKLAEAQARQEKIIRASPLGYYGLQSSLALGKDLSSYAEPVTRRVVKFNGTPTTRQLLSLWKIRAFLEAGLLDHARDEANFLAQIKPSGSALGQDNADGAALMAEFYHIADFHLAAFAHSVAAISLDPTQLNGSTLRILFPNLYEKEFEAAAQQTGINPMLLQSLSKQESAFLPNALSKADALGLMQLLHSTAREMEPNVSRQALLKSEENIKIGSKYLSKLLEKFQGNIAFALAAYNAGPNRASTWQKKFLETSAAKKVFPVDLFIEFIPFTETRKYVSSILRNYYFYKLLDKQYPLPTIQDLAFEWQKKKSPAPPVIVAAEPAPTPPGPDPQKGSVAPVPAAAPTPTPLSTPMPSPIATPEPTKVTP